MKPNTQNVSPFWIKLLPTFLQNRLLGRYNLFAILHNSGWLVFEKLIRGILTLLVGAWVARYLGPSKFGQLAYVLAYISFFQAIAVLGLDGIVVREIAKFQHLHKYNTAVNKNHIISFNTIGELLGTAFFMRLFTGIFCWLLAVLVMIIVEGFNSQSVYLVALAGGSLVFQAADTIDLWFQSQTKSKLTVVSKMVAYLISNGLRIIFILLKLSVVYFAFALLLEFAFAAFALYISYTRFKCGSEWINKTKSLGILLMKESWPLTISGLSVVIYMRIDQIMIHQMLNNTQVGYFSTAATLGSITYFIPNILNISLMPNLTNLKLVNEDKFKSKLSKIFRIYFALSLIICITISAFSPKIIYIIYGKEFNYSSSVLSIFIFTNIPVFLGVGQGIWILNEKKQKLMLFQTLMGSIVAVFANYILISNYGINGAALSAVISYFSSALLFNFFFERKLFYMQIGNPFNLLKLK